MHAWLIHSQEAQTLATQKISSFKPEFKMLSFFAKTFDILPGSTIVPSLGLPLYSEIPSRAVTLLYSNRVFVCCLLGEEEMGWFLFSSLYAQAYHLTGLKIFFLLDECIKNSKTAYQKHLETDHKVVEHLSSIP